MALLNKRDSSLNRRIVTYLTSSTDDFGGLDDRSMYYYLNFAHPVVCRAFSEELETFGSCRAERDMQLMSIVNVAVPASARQPGPSSIGQRALEDEFQSPRDPVLGGRDPVDSDPETHEAVTPAGRMYVETIPASKLPEQWEDDPETHVASPE